MKETKQIDILKKILATQVLIMQNQSKIINGLLEIRGKESAVFAYNHYDEIVKKINNELGAVLIELDETIGEVKG